MSSLSHGVTEEEKNWLARGQQKKDVSWCENGVRMFKALLQSDPVNIRYKLKLAELLLELGRDEKMRQFRYDDARELFDEVLLHDPNEIVAHYHLAVLDINDHKWTSAIEHLTLYQAFEDCVDESRVKTLCYLAVAYHHLDETDEAQELFDQALALNEQWNNETIEFTKFNLGIRPYETSKPYIMLSSEDDKPRYLDDDEYDEARRPVSGMVILNMALNKPSFNGPKKSVHMGQMLAELLAVLLSKPSVIRSAELVEWSDSKLKPSDVKVYINRLRESIRSCFDEPIDDVLKTHRGLNGYEWNYPCSYRIIRRTT